MVARNRWVRSLRAVTEVGVFKPLARYILNTEVKRGVTTRLSYFPVFGIGFWKPSMALSSSGRTAPSHGVNTGSTPVEVTELVVAGIETGLSVGAMVKRPGLTPIATSPTSPLGDYRTTHD